MTIVPNHPLVLKLIVKLPSPDRYADIIYVNFQKGSDTYVSWYQQILMGGRTKYIVNGHNAQQQTVQNLFQSVQLNINNPHFLIMQGRITKVLNMKPAEILSMIEEAAGTKMFEDRKAKAFATMTKKEKKVEEINTVSFLDYVVYMVHRMSGGKQNEWLKVD